MKRHEIKKLQANLVALGELLESELEGSKLPSLWVVKALAARQLLAESADDLEAFLGLTLNRELNAEVCDGNQ